MNKKLLIGGIGTGVIFNHAHLNALIKCPEVELVGIYDWDEKKAKKTRENYLEKVAQLKESEAKLEGVREDIKIFSSAQELYDACEAVTVCTHPRYHVKYAVEAMQNGCHVMSEKPAARTWLEVDYLKKVQEETGMIYQLNDDNVFLDRFRRLKNIIESNMVGPVQNIWISRGSWGLEGPSFGAWFWDRHESGGGSILDYGSHALTSMWFAMGFDKEPVEVRSLGIKTNFKTRNVEGRYQRVNNDDNAKFKARFIDPENGDWQTVVVETTWSGGELGSGPNFKNGDVNGYIEVQCLNGTITAVNDPSEDGKDFFLVKHRMFGERIIPFSFAGSEEGSFQAEVLNFALSVKAGKEPILSAQVGANVLKVLNAAQLSEYLGGVNVTPQQLEKFENDIFEQEKDIWKAADIITDKLTLVTEYNQ